MSIDMPPHRLFFLDWVRNIAFVMLVSHHAGTYYVTWDFHIKSPYAGALLEPWMRLVSPWRMALLCLVSGAATSFMLLPGGASGALLRVRARWLLIPLVFGMLPGGAAAVLARGGAKAEAKAGVRGRLL